MAHLVLTFSSVRIRKWVAPIHALMVPERMFCGLTSDAHTRGRSVQPLLHRVEDGFVLPSLDAPFFGRRVLRFHIADRRGQLGDFPKGPAFVLAPVERVRPEGLQ
jgi:hypothetical protein